MFTDDDLDYMKQCGLNGCGGEREINELIKGLLVRLEAAEQVIKFSQPIIDDDRQSIEYTSGVDMEYEQAMEAWRKSAGK